MLYDVVWSLQHEAACCRTIAVLEKLKILFKWSRAVINTISYSRTHVYNNPSEAVALDVLFKSPVQ